MTNPHTAYIGVGSNIGERADNCIKGVETIGQCDGCAVEAVSHLYETEPVYLESQGWFVNAVARISTDLAPAALFERLKAIERAMGRMPSEERFGPRVLDLDILLYDDCVFQNGILRVPHPMLHERRFVLEPLCELAPEFEHPVLGTTMRGLLCDLNDGDKKVRLYR